MILGKLYGRRKKSRQNEKKQYSWETIELEKVQRLMEIGGNLGLTDDERVTETLAVLHDTTTEAVLNWPLLRYSKAAAELGWMADKIKKPTARKQIIIIDGVKYIPTTASTMTAAQYIDFNHWGKMKDRDTSKEILATLLIPEGKRYGEGYDVQELVGKCGKIPYRAATEVLAFFLNKSRKLPQDIRRFLTKEQRTAIKTTSSKLRRSMRRLF